MLDGPGTFGRPNLLKIAGPANIAHGIFFSKHVRCSFQFMGDFCAYPRPPRATERRVSYFCAQKGLPTGMGD